MILGAEPLDPAADPEFLADHAGYSDGPESGPAAEIASEDGQETDDDKDDPEGANYPRTPPYGPRPLPGCRCWP